MEKQGGKTAGNTNTGKTGEKIPQPGRSKRETPKQVMARHVKDKKDVITDEEFKNLQTGTGVSDDTTHEPLEISDDKNRPKDEDKDPKIVTPWDVIS